MKTTAAGIDYSTGMENRNLETGIHYGVIHQNECLQAWADSSEAFFPPCCPKCGNKIAETFENIIEAIEEAQQQDAVYSCPSCYDELDQDDFDFAEASGFYMDDGEYSAEADDYGDIFITKSPYYTRCRYCSPCAPGAGYIMSQDSRGIKTYCFGHDFFDSGRAPYKVYSVKTNRIVKAEEASNE